MTDAGYMIVVSKTTTTTGEACYLASHPQLPGCMASGTTEDDARENLDDARDLYLGALERRGIPAPPPTGGAPTTSTTTSTAPSARSRLPKVAIIA